MWEIEVGITNVMVMYTSYVPNNYVYPTNIMWHHDAKNLQSTFIKFSYLSTKLEEYIQCILFLHYPNIFKWHR